MTYTVRKKIFSKDSTIEKMEIHFLNGDFLTIRKNEIFNISINFYDELLRSDDKLYPIARSGFVKLKIQNGRAKWESRSLYDDKEYIASRKDYIESRCVCDSIKFIKLYNQNNWSDIIYGDVLASHEGDYLFLRYTPHDSLGDWESENHQINLSHPLKDTIFTMRLDFENCEGVDVYRDEIVDMNLVFSSQLDWVSSGYVRRVRGGYIRIKFDDGYENRYVDVWNSGKKVKLKHIERRICGKGCESVDICNLYLDFHGGCELKSEHITVDSLYQPSEESELGDYDDFDEYYDSLEANEDTYDDDFFESGYAKKLDDGSILIIFGKHKRA